MPGSLIEFMYENTKLNSAQSSQSIAVFFFADIASFEAPPTDTVSKYA